MPKKKQFLQANAKQAARGKKKEPVRLEIMSRPSRLLTSPRSLRLRTISLMLQMNLKRALASGEQETLPSLLASFSVPLTPMPLACKSFHSLSIWHTTSEFASFLHRYAQPVLLSSSLMSLHPWRTLSCIRRRQPCNGRLKSRFLFKPPYFVHLVHPIL